MKFEAIKVGMKLKLVGQREGLIWSCYTGYGWQIGDTILVFEKCGTDYNLKNLRTNEKHFCIPDGMSTTYKDKDRYSNFFEPINQTMKELLE